MIMLARGIVTSAAYLRSGAPIGLSAFEGSQWFGRELRGASLGIVGMGRVGHCVAERALALGMQVQATDPHLPAAAFPPGIAATDLPTLLATSDFVSLHARAAADNVGMMGRETLAMMRPDAFLINTARASLVDEAALAEAVAGGRIAGAALDVLQPHGVGSAHPLTQLERVIATPHIGGATDETLVRGARMIVEELERFAAGEPLHHAAEPTAAT
jgi:phosphoglycerate dehydrogenase-like enzyme